MTLLKKMLISFSIFITILGIFSCSKETNERYRIVHVEGKYLIYVCNTKTIEYAKSLIDKVILEIPQNADFSVTSDEIENNSVDIIELVPTNEEFPDWKRAGQVTTYVGKEIFKDRLYADRELFLSYNFQKQASVDYQHPKLGRAPYLRLDIYDMGSSKDAFGIYSVNRFPRLRYNTRIGNEAIIKSQFVYLWKDRYYVEIEAFEYADDIYDGMINLAKAVDKKIKLKGELPDLLKLLPKELHIKRSEKYFHEFVALKKIDASIDKVNTLNLDDKTSGVFARYRHKESNGSVLDTVKLLLIYYPDKERAESAYQSYTEYLQQDSSLTIVSEDKSNMVLIVLYTRRT